MIDRGYWRHAGGDRIWAVEIEDGRPVKCAGPFDDRSTAQILIGRDLFSAGRRVCSGCSRADETLVR